jgi:hypothetical protein
LAVPNDPAGDVFVGLTVKVLDAHRRLGIATEILRLDVAYCEEQGLHALITPCNARLQSLLQPLGFTMIRPLPGFLPPAMMASVMPNAALFERRFERTTAPHDRGGSAR